MSKKTKKFPELPIDTSIAQDEIIDISIILRENLSEIDVKDQALELEYLKVAALIRIAAILNPNKDGSV